MATIKFRLIGNNVYSDFTISREKKFRKKTGFTTTPEQWKTKKSTRPDEKGKYKRNADLDSPVDSTSKKLKSQLDSLEKAILEQYNEDYSNGIEINSNWFESAIKKHTNQDAGDKDLFIFQIQKAIDDAPRKKVRTRGGKFKIGLSKGRIKGINQFLNIIERFQEDEYNGTQIRVPNIDLDTVSDFEDWLFKNGYSDNTIGKHLGNFKAILNGINEVQVNINPSDIRIISDPKEPEDIIYLSFEELEKIKSLRLTTNYLNNARKWLILGCYVGQRVSDLLRLSPKKITTIRGRKVFEIKQQKTGTKVTIPIFPEADEIIKSGFPHKISDTKLREYIKIICRLAEIDEPTNGRIRETSNGTSTKGVYPKWKLIGTHVCRRSFATNFYGQMPTILLKRITGHSTEKMFLKYIGKDDENFIEQMYNYIDKLPKSRTMEIVKNEKKTGTDNLND